jgi:rhodanese-related sulfurtransferase
MTKVSFRRIQPLQARDLLAHPDIRIIDVREKNSFEQGRIGAAQYAGMPEVERMFFSLDKNKPVLIYCYHGHASQTYAQMFADFGFPEVYSLDGGYQGWQQAAASENSTAMPPSPGLTAWLLEQGFPPHGVNSTIANQTTPLIQAARFGVLKTAEELIACGAKLNTRNGDGNNALWLACFHGSLGMMELLISKDVDLDNQNESGATCLMYAASASKTAVVAKLLDAGADPSLQSPDDFSALDMAANIECLNLLRKATKSLV